MQIKLTESACRRISELLSKEPEDTIGLRVSVRGGGCSGFKYSYKFIVSVSPDDLIIEQNGVKVVLDHISQKFLANCTLDFIESLQGSYFEVRNPNATSRCGCGSSFSV